MPTAVAEPRLRLLPALATAVRASLAAGAVMAGGLLAIAEIASEPTAVAGVDSSTWTPLTAITSFFFGVDAFAGDFELPAILFGLAVHAVMAVLVGGAITALVAVALGPRPRELGATVLAVAAALCVQVIAVNLIVNAVQDVHTVYEALPQWGWFAGHAAFGAALGILLGRTALG